MGVCASVVAAAVCIVGVMLAGGWGREAVVWGAGAWAAHAGVSFVAGVIAGVSRGGGWGVGGHLGLYHVASPVAVVWRVGWLRRNRPGFLRAGWRRVFFATYAGMVAVLVGGGMVMRTWAATR